MKILKELDQSERDTLKEKHRGHHLFCTHIATVLDKPHCFMVNVLVEDYAEILIYSGLLMNENFPYQTLSASIMYIKENQSFLETTHHGFLDGQTVKRYLAKLSTCQKKLPVCFTELGDCFMLDKSETSDEFRNEITDGMHRLVAYGLATDMNESHFPIPIYFGTNKTTLPT